MGGILGNLFGFIDSGRAAKTLSNQYMNAMNGILTATKDAQNAVGQATTQGQQGALNAAQAGQAGVNGAVSNAGTLLNNGANTAIGSVNGAVGGANDILSHILSGIQSGTNAYTDAGASGLTNLQNFASSAPQFSFNYQDYANDPAFQFQMDSGTKAINNSMAASGMASSGAAAKELAQYGSGLAATHYQDAFNRALSGFGANQSARAQQLQGIQSQLQAGEFGTGLNANAATTLGGQMGQNTMAGGLFAGNTQNSIAQLLSQLGLQGAEYNGTLGSNAAQYAGNLGVQGQTTAGQMGMQGSQLAGNYAIGMGNAQAGGILGQGNALAGGVAGLGSLLSMFV